MADDAVSRAVEAGARALISDFKGASHCAMCAEDEQQTRAIVAAFLKSLASEPTPEMVDAFRAGWQSQGGEWDHMIRAGWRAMASRAAEQVEETPDAG